MRKSEDNQMDKIMRYKGVLLVKQSDIDEVESFLSSKDIRMIKEEDDGFYKVHFNFTIVGEVKTDDEDLKKLASFDNYVVTSFIGIGNENKGLIYTVEK